MEAAKKQITTSNSESIVSVGNESIILMDLQEAVFSMLRAYHFAKKESRREKRTREGQQRKKRGGKEMMN